MKIFYFFFILKIVSSNESNELNVTKKVIIDDDIEYEFTGWNSNKPKIGNGGDSNENNLLINRKVENKNEFIVELNDSFESKKNSLTINKLNLNCSLPINLNGDCSFNNCLTTVNSKNLEELYQKTEIQLKQNNQDKNNSVIY